MLGFVFCNQQGNQHYLRMYTNINEWFLKHFYFYSLARSYLPPKTIGIANVRNDPPELIISYKWTTEFYSFVKDCLTKNQTGRPKAKHLLKNHPFVNNIQNEAEVREEIRAFFLRNNEAESKNGKEFVHFPYELFDDFDWILYVKLIKEN
ncbi:serine/threonine-protein kinase 10-like [Xenopus laevis]|uniref:Serine/threonine-protein kinase 10-like n=1 Tax=Xenopus laevis TaxID=8355 RepID=A0A8J1KV89_XENLA|nr:serine/threonine-protein kinase 10-like [Xenopus laevis]